MHKRGNYSQDASWDFVDISNTTTGDQNDQAKDTTLRIPNNQNRRGGNQKHNYGRTMHAYLLDEDVDMPELAPPSHLSTITRGGRRGAKNEGRKHNLSDPDYKLCPGPSGFYEVKIPYMRNYSKDYIMNEIKGHLQPDLFQPLYFKLDHDVAYFFVNDFIIAEKILNLDEVISLPNGHKMMIKVRSGIPEVIINDGFRAKMTAVFAKRYITSTKALNLSSLYTDPELRDVYCSLANPQIVNEAVQLIATIVPDLRALNLDDNQISIIDHMKCIPEKLPCLEILHLKNNMLLHISQLEYFKELPLVELNLDGNPLKEKFTDPDLYIREVRTIFPNIMKLDNKEFHPEMSFDSSKSVALPTPKATFLVNAATEDIIRQFLLQYFFIYDSESRQPLFDAYDQQAIMSLSAYLPKEKNTVYDDINRNLYQYADDGSRTKTLQEGRLEILALLTKLPKTQHDPSSFKIDLTFFSPSLLVLSITGLFKELNGENDPPVRAFFRTMIIVPAGSGLCIRNDEICIVSPTPSQIKDAFKAPLISAAAELVPTTAVIRD